MQIVDVTRPISDAMAIWPGDPLVAVRRASGPDEASVSKIELGTHTGTHVDPPAHYFAEGKTVDLLPLEALIGPAWVAVIPGPGPIRSTDLAAAPIPPGTLRLLLRTPNSERPIEAPFDADFVALAPDAADWLLHQQVLLVGIDGPSIEPYDPSAEATSGNAAAEATPGDPVHRLLLGAGVIVVEYLDLSGVEPGPYQLCCLPLRIATGDGAPARVVLMTLSEEALGAEAPFATASTGF